jgi:very-short-patch-repair endonuclease
MDVSDGNRRSMESPIDVNHPFTTAQWIAAGNEVHLLRRRDFQQVIGRVWVHRNGLDDETLIRASLAIHPDDAFASHVSAARVLGLPVPDHPFAHVTVAKHEDRRFRPRIKPHVTKRRRQVIVVRGIRTTDPIATFIDCAGMLSLIELVILGDALVKKFGVEPQVLLKACRDSTDYYAGLATAAAEYVRKGVDSPMETRLRMLIVLAGLPEPEVNFKLYREDGTWRRRFDLSYPAIKLIVEYDGRHHAEDKTQWDKDLERREEFDDEGYRVLVVTSKGIFVEPERTLHRVRRQLVLRGYGDVPAIDPRWREHFGAA